MSYAVVGPAVEDAAVVRLWLDDVRSAPPGWLHVKTIGSAKEVLLNEPVESLSLDHDLGEGYNDGSALVRWMARKNIWPHQKPVVHSMNPVGRAYMEGVIDRYWNTEV